MKNKTRRHTPQMIAEKRPNSHYPTVDEVVEVENDLVYNCVCDTHQFGAMLLIPSQDEAHAEFNAGGRRPDRQREDRQRDDRGAAEELAVVHDQVDQSGGGYRGEPALRDGDTPPGLLEMSIFCGARAGGGGGGAREGGGRRAGARAQAGGGGGVEGAAGG